MKIKSKLKRRVRLRPIKVGWFEHYRHSTLARNLSQFKVNDICRYFYSVNKFWEFVVLNYSQFIPVIETMHEEVSMYPGEIEIIRSNIVDTMCYSPNWDINLHYTANLRWE